jgi:hypothetical protein
MKYAREMFPWNGQERPNRCRSHRADGYRRQDGHQAHSRDERFRRLRLAVVLTARICHEARWPATGSMRCCLSPTPPPSPPCSSRAHGSSRPWPNAEGRQGLPRQAGGATARCARGRACLCRQGTHSGGQPCSRAPRPSIPMQRTCWQAALPGRSLRPAPRGAKLFSKLGRLLQDDKTYRCLLTIPGIGPKSASALATSLFLRDSKLVVYCSLIPADHDSGSSIRSQKSAHKGNKALKNLLIFSCNSLVGTKKRFGRYYDAWQRQGHEAQQGAQGSGPQEALCHLCNDA